MEIDFTPGQTAFIERRLGSHQRRGVCRIIGAHDPNYLLLTAPVAEGKAMLMQEGSRCIIRYLVEGNMIGFWATVVRTVAEPFAMVILELPEEHEQMLLRKAERIACNLPVSIQLPEAEETAGDGEQPLVRGVIIDLAEGGCQIAVSLESPGASPSPDETRPDALSDDDQFETEYYAVDFLQKSFRKSLRLRLAFALPAPVETEHQDVEGEVCWAKVAQGFFFIGVRFPGETGSLGTNVQRLVKHQMMFFTQRIRPVH